MFTIPVIERLSTNTQVDEGGNNCENNDYNRKSHSFSVID